MLIIRLQRIGKKHAPEYRLVVAEKRKHVSKQVHTVLGNYSPITKKLVVKPGVDINKFLDLNIAQSDSVSSILKKNGFEKKKAEKSTKEAPKKAEKPTAEKKVTKKPAAKKTTKS